MLICPSFKEPGGCIAQAPSTPQLIGANLGAAWLTLCYVQAWLDGRPIFDGVTFDTRRFALHGQGNPILLDGAPLETR